MSSRIDEIISFWFSGSLDTADLISERIKVWFHTDETFDNEIRERFQSDYEAAIHGQLDSWKNSSRGMLALILILDQFSRNMFRGTQQAFAQDHIALQLCLEGIAQGRDIELSQLERAFFYMPLQHAEDNDLQELGMKKYKQLHSQTPEGIKKEMLGFLNASTEHRNIIKQFGRFPHRNQILKRASTNEEEKFLKTQNSWYGQRPVQ
ncbi:MAG: DUF924 family protein [Spirochaetota bacterium]|nr:DUF924 family protein [Spirochaetota bacterium]